jgi:glycosyltransferase involved in cell wall biosynthesis
MVDPRLLVISPVRNESAHIERVARAVAAQELRPTAWIVVDDGSTDRTVELLRPFQAELPFLTVVATANAPGVDPLAEGAAPRAFNAGLERAAGRTFTHIMKLDGDVELPPTYLRELLERFDADPQLGIACGDLLEESPGGLRRIAIPPHHVHGALKC